MKVFKFGGTSLEDGSGMVNVADIISSSLEDHLIVVVSAAGKTTNALEKVLDLKFKGNVVEAGSVLNEIMDYHQKLMEDLLIPQSKIKALFDPIKAGIQDLFQSECKDPFDQCYDQWVSQGEIMSSAILTAYLETRKLNVKYYDARKIILTNHTFREAKIQWAKTRKNLLNEVDLSGPATVHIFQGFIGGTEDGQTTTLGREGSDFSGAILSFCLDAESLTIWKDVSGVLTADPRIFENVVKIGRMSYKEVIEMTYFGAKVIHPKTIKPLQNKNIPLYVKPFSFPSEAGTLISSGLENEYPPVVVIEKNQALLHISSKDFSFIAEDHLSQIFNIFTMQRIKVNMMRNSAISFTVCVSYRMDKMEAAKAALLKDFNVVVDENLELITIRHFSKNIVKELKKDKVVLFEERLRDTLQMVVKSLPRIKRKVGF